MPLLFLQNWKLKKRKCVYFFHLQPFWVVYGNFLDFFMDPVFPNSYIFHPFFTQFSKFHAISPCLQYFLIIFIQILPMKAFVFSSDHVVISNFSASFKLSWQRVYWFYRPEKIVWNIERFNALLDNLNASCNNLKLTQSCLKREINFHLCYNCFCWCYQLLSLLPLSIMWHHRLP